MTQPLNHNSTIANQCKMKVVPSRCSCSSPVSLLSGSERYLAPTDPNEFPELPVRNKAQHHACIIPSTAAQPLANQKQIQILPRPAKSSLCKLSDKIVRNKSQHHACIAPSNTSEIKTKSKSHFQDAVVAAPLACRAALRDALPLQAQSHCLGCE